MSDSSMLFHGSQHYFLVMLMIVCVDAANNGPTFFCMFCRFHIFSHGRQHAVLYLRLVHVMIYTVNNCIIYCHGVYMSEMHVSEMLFTLQSCFARYNPLSPSDHINVFGWGGVGLGGPKTFMLFLK